MPQSRTLAVGLDVHQDASAVAYAAQAHGAEGIPRGTLGTRQVDSDPLPRTLHSQAKPLVLVDDASPCGSWRSRDLRHTGYDGGGVAPSRSPTQAGERVHTNRRDAINLARLMRAGALTPLSGPTGEDEALRDRGRAREEAIGALKAATLRRTACLRRPDSRSTGRATWGPAHRRWRRAGVWPPPAQQLVFQDYVRAVHEHPERRERRAHERTAQVQTGRLAPVLDALQAWRGVQFTGAVTTVADRGDLTRLTNPRQVRPSLGFTPAASSTGERRRQGGRTKTGHTQARRALIEGAGADRSPAHVSRPLPLRLEKGPKPVPDRRGTAQVRLCTRDRQLSARGTPPPQGSWPSRGNSGR
jgi:transposase